MNYHIITEDEKREACTWHYEGDYACYDLPAYEEMAEKKMVF